MSLDFNLNKTMKATKKEEEAMLECYRRLYKNAEPSGDFDKLYKEVKQNTRTSSFYNDFCLKESEQEKIINDCIKEFKIKPKYRQESFKNTITLGCSPRYK